MTSLTQLCYTSIAQTIEEAPPMIQEMIVQETSKHMEEKALERAMPKAVKRALEVTEIQFTEILPGLVSVILTDIMRLMVVPSGELPDYYIKYQELPPHIVRCAVETAENTARTLNTTVTTAAFQLYGQPACNHCDINGMGLDYSSDETPDSDGSWY